MHLWFFKGDFLFGLFIKSLLLCNQKLPSLLALHPGGFWGGEPLPFRNGQLGLGHYIEAKLAQLALPSSLRCVLGETLIKPSIPGDACLRLTNQLTMRRLWPWSSMLGGAISCFLLFIGAR